MKPSNEELKNELQKRLSEFALDNGGKWEVDTSTENDSFTYYVNNNSRGRVFIMNTNGFSNIEVMSNDDYKPELIEDYGNPLKKLNPRRVVMTSNRSIQFYSDFKLNKLSGASEIISEIEEDKSNKMDFEKGLKILLG